MAFGKPREPYLRRQKIALAVVEEQAIANPDWVSLQVFVSFLRLLNWSKTEIYFEETQHGYSGSTGYRVIHFPEKIKEKWTDTFYTWFGLTAWIS